MKVNSANLIYWDLKGIVDTREWTQFEIRTIGFFVFGNASKKQDVTPKLIYNVVKHGRTVLELRGKERLKSPINFKL